MQQFRGRHSNLRLEVYWGPGGNPFTFAMTWPINGFAVVRQSGQKRLIAYTSAYTSLFKQRQNLFIEEFKTSAQHLGIGGVRRDIHRDQLRH